MNITVDTSTPIEQQLETIQNESQTQETNTTIEQQSQTEQQTENNNSLEIKADEQKTEQKDTQTLLNETQKTVEDAQKLVSDKGLDYDALAQEYEDNGKLSDKTYEALQGAGFPKNVVDMFIKGIEASNAQFVNEVKTYAGGDEKYNQITQFVKAQGQTAIDGFNATINSGNLQSIKLMLDGINASIIQRNGTAKATVMGSASATSSQGYANEAELCKAIDDKRYGVDKAYTEEVTQRLMKSSFVKYNRF